MKYCFYVKSIKSNLNNKMSSRHTVQVTFQIIVLIRIYKKISNHKIEYSI